MMKRLKTIYLALLAIMMPVCAGCSNPANLSVTQYSIKEIAPTGFRSVHGTVGLEISNTGAKWEVQSVTGRLCQGTAVLGNFSVAPFDIPSGLNWVDVNGDISLDDNVSLMTILSMAGNFNLDNYSISVEAKIKSGVMSTTLKKNNIPLRKFIRRQ